MERYDVSLTATRYPRYHGNVIRPASEADSLILQVMYGCSHGKCTFCGSYMDKAFRLRPVDAVVEDIEGLAESTKQNVQRVFMCDGDALALPVERLTTILDTLVSELPSLTRVSAYANPHSLMSLSDEELGDIRAHGLELLHVGLESGDDETLSRSWKGLWTSQIVTALKRAKAAGFVLSVTAILGLGGVERSVEHAHATAQALSAIDPQSIVLLSLMIEPGTRIADLARRGQFVLPGPLEMLLELRDMLTEIEVTDAAFRTSRISNYVALEGRLPEDKEAMLQTVDRVLAMGEAAPLMPEVLRGM